MPGHKDWLQKSSGELRAARLLINDDVILDIAAFHAHQCAEKALKGYLMFQRKSIPKTHNLEEILENCATLNQEFLNFLHDAIILDPYAINTRYPDDRFKIDKFEVQKAIEHADRIFKFVQNQITF